MLLGRSVDGATGRDGQLLWRKEDDRSAGEAVSHPPSAHRADPTVAGSGLITMSSRGKVDAFNVSNDWFPEAPAFDEWMRPYQGAALVNGGEPQAGRRLLSWAAVKT